LVSDITSFPALPDLSVAAVRTPLRGADSIELDGDLRAEPGAAITDAVGKYERRYAPLEPTELRLCIDSLAPLLNVHDEESVFVFLLLVTAYIRGINALGHVHLSADRSDYVARLLAPLFDAVVEVRSRQDHHQQRWHLDGGTTTSRWSPASPPRRR
jgi:hypothetical protein